MILLPRLGVSVLTTLQDELLRRTVYGYRLTWKN